MSVGKILSSVMLAAAVLCSMPNRTVAEEVTKKPSGRLVARIDETIWRTHDHNVYRADIVATPPYGAPDGPHELTEYVLTITCIEKCDHPVTYRSTIERPTGLFQLGPSTGQLVVLSESGGPAGMVQVYNLSKAGIKRVLDVGSRAPPEFSYAEDGFPIVTVDAREGGIEDPVIVHWHWNGSVYVSDRPH